MVLVVPVYEILQDGTTFPDLEVVATLVRVDDGRNAAVGVDVEEPLLFLLVFKDLNCAYLHTDCVRVFKIFICLFSPFFSGSGAMVHGNHTLYFKPSSSSAMEILSGLGVPSQ